MSIFAEKAKPTNPLFTAKQKHKLRITEVKELSGDKYNAIILNYAVLSEENKGERGSLFINKELRSKEGIVSPNKLMYKILAAFDIEAVETAYINCEGTELEKFKVAVDTFVKNAEHIIAKDVTVTFSAIKATPKGKFQNIVTIEMVDDSVEEVTEEVPF